MCSLAGSSRQYPRAEGPDSWSRCGPARRRGRIARLLSKARLTTTRHSGTCSRLSVDSIQALQVCDSATDDPSLDDCVFAASPSVRRRGLRCCDNDDGIRQRELVRRVWLCLSIRVCDWRHPLLSPAQTHRCHRRPGRRVCRAAVRRSAQPQCGTAQQSAQGDRDLPGAASST